MRKARTEEALAAASGTRRLDGQSPISYDGMAFGEGMEVVRAY